MCQCLKHLETSAPEALRMRFLARDLVRCTLLPRPSPTFAVSSQRWCLPENRTGPVVAGVARWGTSSLPVPIKQDSRSLGLVTAFTRQYPAHRACRKVLLEVCEARAHKIDVLATCPHCTLTTNRRVSGGRSELHCRQRSAPHRHVDQRQRWGRWRTRCPRQGDANAPTPV